MVIAGLLAILLMVLTLPFAVKKLKRTWNLFARNGVAAALISGVANKELIMVALHEPIMIATAVLVADIIFYFKQTICRFHG